MGETYKGSGGGVYRCLGSRCNVSLRWCEFVAPTITKGQTGRYNKFLHGYYLSSVRRN